MAWWAACCMLAQTAYRMVQYDEEDGVPSSHITQLLQDSHGFMWFSTWNGLCRFDGYEFHTFKPQAGDGCHMANDRIRDIALRPDGQIICKVEADEYYLFDTRRCRFHDVAPQDLPSLSADILKHRQSRAAYHDDASRHTTFEYDDPQGNHWLLGDGGITLSVPMEKRTQRLAIEPATEVKCLYKDSPNRYWMTTREDAAVRIYNSEMQLMGYLGRDGNIHKGYTSFGAAVYCMYETADGRLWLGSKPQGLFCLVNHGDVNHFDISRPVDMQLQDVYNIKEDRQGRLWVATMRNGLYCSTDYTGDHPHFFTPKHYPKDYAQRIRHLHITSGGILLAAATDGLMVAKLEKNVDSMCFQRHRREGHRAESMSSSATMDIMEDGRGHLLISTESGGVNIVNEGDLLNEKPVFRHLNMATHLLTNDIALSLASMEDGRTMVVSSNVVTLLDSTGHSRVLVGHGDRHLTQAWVKGPVPMTHYRFGDARPLPLANGQWLFGLKDGAITTSTEQMFMESNPPKVVLTCASIQGGSDNWGIENCDTITLQPHERSITIHFAALDYSAPELIRYAFRLDKQDGNTQWNHIQHSRTATLLDLEPGTYLLEIRSTNVDGEWQDNMRRLTIIVTPTFWEAWYGQLLIVLLIMGAVAAIVYTLLYIRRIRRQHRETLEAYLALMQNTSLASQPSPLTSHPSSLTSHPSPLTSHLDPMLERVMHFIEENISNADIGVGDLAAAAAVSRSGLQRKLKQTMGITPQELLSEARMKKACQLLQESDKTVAEIAYACGFNDPKYFSRCFKQSTGKTPSEYKNTL